MKKFILIIGLFLMSIPTIGQISIGKSMGQIITEKAVEECFVVVKQSYQLKDKKTGKTFGKNGRSDFGHSYSLGVKTCMGLVITDDVLKPWTIDKDFKKVGDAYEPIISLTEVRPLVGKEKLSYVQCPLHIGSNQPDGLWIASTGNNEPNSMEIDSSSGKKEGWIVWLTAKQSLEDNPDASFTLQTLSKEVEVNENKDLEIESFNSNDYILGGVYVCPVYSGGGHVSFQLVGVMIKENDKWKLRTSFIGMATDVPSISNNQGVNGLDSNEEDLNLTPIEQDKKKSKNK